MEEYNYKLGSQVIKRRWKKASICHNWAVGSASLQIERVSLAKLRELRMIKRFTLKEQSQFGQIQLSVRKNWRMSFANWLICAASYVWYIANALILVYSLSQFTWILNNFSNSLIIHKEKTKEIITEKEVWIRDPNYHKIRWTLALNFSKKYQCFEKLWQTLERKFHQVSKHFKVRLRLFFSTHFSVFGYVRKHSSLCLIYYGTHRTNSII